MFFLHRTKHFGLREGLSLYHLIAGGYGLVFTLDLAPRLISQLDVSVRLAAAVGFAGVALVFGSVLAAGFLLVKRPLFGTRFAVVLQLLQIPVLSTGGFAFSFFAGLYAAVVSESGNVHWLAGWKASLQLSWFATSGFVGVNLAPLGVIWLLRRAHATTPLETDAAPPAP